MVAAAADAEGGATSPHMIRSLTLFALVSLSVACGGAEDVADEEGTTTEAEGELRAASIKSIVVGRSPGFVAPPPGGGCTVPTRYTYDLASRELVKNVCRGRIPGGVTTTVSKADAKKIKSAINRVRLGDKPTSCPTDVPVRYIDVTRASGETNYVEERSACGGGVTPAQSEDIDALLTLLGDIADRAQGIAPNP